MPKKKVYKDPPLYDFEVVYCDKNSRTQVAIIPEDHKDVDRLVRNLKFELSIYPNKYYGAVTEKGKMIEIPIAGIDFGSIKYLGVYGKYNTKKKTGRKL